MPIAINNNDVIQVVVYTRQAEQAGLNVLHYYAGNKTGTGGNVEDIGDAMQTQLQIAYVPCMASAADFLGCSGRRVWPLNVTAEFFSTGIGSAGSGTGDVLPRQTCGLITKKSAFAGKREKGRVYIPFPSEGMNDSTGIPTTPYMTNLAGIANALDGIVTVGTITNFTDLTPVIYHRDLHVVSTIVQFLPKRRWATQRRRSSFGAANVLPF